MKSLSEMIKTKAVELLSGVLIRQAEQACSSSKTVFFSEPEFPIELLREESK